MNLVTKRLILREFQVDDFGSVQNTHLTQRCVDTLTGDQIPAKTHESS